MQLRSFLLAALCTVAAVLPVRAHHSQGMYDVATWLTLEGTIYQVRWTFPHAWIYLQVEDGQNPATLWALEGTNPNTIQMSGVSKDDVRPGDRISVRCHPLKDGSAGCVLGFVTPVHGDTARGHGVETAWN